MKKISSNKRNNLDQDKAQKQKEINLKRAMQVKNYKGRTIKPVKR